jgi:hypothetical protein
VFDVEHEIVTASHREIHERIFKSDDLSEPLGDRPEPPIVGELNEQLPARSHHSSALVDQRELATARASPVGLTHEVAASRVVLGDEPATQEGCANVRQAVWYP